MSSCTICHLKSKYKCPVCHIPYCSVACYKTHKELPCTAPGIVLQTKEETEKPMLDYEYPTEDTVPHERLKLLENSEGLKTCLANPHVRDILTLLDKSIHPDALIQEYMQEPIFTEFVDECLKVVNPPGDECDNYSQ